MILCLGTTPALQRVMVFRSLRTGEVNRARQTRAGVAGKSINVAKVLHALGQNVNALGFAGGSAGQVLRKELDHRGIPHALIEVAHQTRTCVTVIDESDGKVTELVEESPPVEPEAFEELFERTEETLRHCQAMVLSGSIAPGGGNDFYRRLAELGQQANVLTVIDAQGESLRQALIARPGLIKPNRAELAATVGRSLADEREVWEAMRELSQRGARHVVVTASTDAILAWDGEQGWRLWPPHVQAVNPIGSGDSFTAGLVARLVAGEDLGESCRWGTAAGAANALTWMAGEVDFQDVQRLKEQVQWEKV